MGVCIYAIWMDIKGRLEGISAGIFWSMAALHFDILSNSRTGGNKCIKMVNLQICI